MAAGHACLTHIVQGTVCKILAAHEIKPHKVRYYLERRDEAFETKMAEVLCVYREVAILKESESAPADVAIISYDEKPGIQAIGNTAPDLPPQPGTHPTFARDHEYKRHGTLSLLAGIDLLTGRVHARVEDRHRSREFVAFLRQLDAAYPADTAIRLILDNHSAHISKETKAWVATQPEGLKAELSVTLLPRMMRRRAKPVHLVVDGLPAHKNALVKEYVASMNGMLTLHLLHGYAPELPPDELGLEPHETHGGARTHTARRKAAAKDRGPTCE